MSCILGNLGGRQASSDLCGRGLSQFLILVGVSLCAFGYASAAAQRPDRPSAIDIKIESSRSQVTAGSGFGVIAEITNTSNSTVYLNQEKVTLTLPPELEGPRPEVGWTAGFPIDPAQTYPPSITIALRPGEAYKAFWYRNPGGRSGASPSLLAYVFDLIYTEMYFIFFSPGDYKISVVAAYWTKPNLPKDDYHTAIQSATLHVAAPQFVILLGAAVGGLIAYFVFPQARRRLIESASEGASGLAALIGGRIPKELGGILASVLLGAITTILLSRISETQFLIRVTVNDLWGAIAIGFVAIYAGSTILAKMLSQVTSGQAAPTAAPTPVAGPPPAPAVGGAPVAGPTPAAVPPPAPAVGGAPVAGPPVNQ